MLSNLPRQLSRIGTVDSARWQAKCSGVDLNEFPLWLGPHQNPTVLPRRFAKVCRLGSHRRLRSVFRQERVGFGQDLVEGVPDPRRDLLLAAYQQEKEFTLGFR